MSLECQGSSLLPVLPFRADSHQALGGGGEAPWSPFFHEQRCYRAHRQQYGVLSSRGLSPSLILSSSPTSLAQSPSTYQPQRWVCGSKVLIFCAHASRACSGGSVRLITSGTRGSLSWGETEISPEPFLQMVHLCLSWGRQGTAVSPTCCKASL